MKLNRVAVPGPNGKVGSAIETINGTNNKKYPMSRKLMLEDINEPFII